MLLVGRVTPTTTSEARERIQQFEKLCRWFATAPVILEPWLLCRNHEGMSHRTFQATPVNFVQVNGLEERVVASPATAPKPSQSLNRSAGSLAEPNLPC